jgi:hypothetical protein
MYQLYQLTLSIAFCIAITGWFAIKWLEQKNSKLNAPIFLFTAIQLQLVYTITSAGFFYFGIGCFVMLMQQ